MEIAPFQKEFLEFCIECDVLRFGEFTLKSGRSSPYFFNAGLFNTGGRLAKLGRFYAAAISNAKLEYDVIFGPAYKGIPLAATTAIALGDSGVDKPYCYNRKEAKDHGEGGVIVGAPLSGRALIVDDVITAGTAAREAAAIIGGQGATLAGIVVALDREEKGGGGTELSAIQQVEEELQIPVISVAQRVGYLMHGLSGVTAPCVRLVALRALGRSYTSRSAASAAWELATASGPCVPQLAPELWMVGLSLTPHQQVVNLTQLIAFLEQRQPEQAQRLREHKEQHGAAKR